MRRALLALLLLASCPGPPVLPAIDGGTDAGQPGGDGGQPGSDGGRTGEERYCDESFADAGVCPSDRCALGCGAGGSGCAAACYPKDCQQFSGALCPLDRCQQMTDCAGRAVCYYRFSGAPPACGEASYYGQDVACCAGLVKRCGLAVDAGVCDAARGGYADLPWCLPCGNGTCDQFETPCSCPADCP